MARTRHDNAATTTLTPQVIVERAIAMADAEGLEAVTIRKLASELGVTPMALYWHFRGINTKWKRAVDPVSRETLIPDTDLAAAVEKLAPQN